MKKLFLITILLLLNACATGTWGKPSGNNSSLKNDTGYCSSLARSRFPGYICDNPLMCRLDEVNVVLDQIIQKKATFQNCMYRRGYNYTEN